jgi:transcriptional regulator with XRE-family HTH domain
MITVRLNIERLRNAAGDDSGCTIAAKANISQSTYSRLAAGLTEPKTSTLVLLGAAFGLSLEDLIKVHKVAA